MAIRECEKVCFVTFNYDTVLEQALQEYSGWTISDFSMYTRHAHYKLIKLHGSIDWGLEFDTPKMTLPSAVVNAAASLKVSDRFFRVTEQSGTIFRGHFRVSCPRHSRR
jgi:SIR2-like protein